MQITKNSVVSMHYTLTNNSGEVIDTNQGRDPLTYIHGTGSIIVGLENALEGKAAGDQIKVTIPPQHAYGEVNPALLQGVPRSAFQGISEIKEGMQFQAQGPQGMQIVRVVKIEPETITVDANHPLAGQTLNFDVKIAEVRAAKAEELSHGHVHGPDCHHH